MDSQLDIDNDKALDRDRDRDSDSDSDWDFAKDFSLDKYEDRSLVSLLKWSNDL